jgi:hypothetical protein
MREWGPKFSGYFPLQFHVLYRQFLLRVVDLETLSIKADVIGFLGQFAGVLIMVSLIFAAYAFIDAFHVERSLISATMLAVGLVTVISWDATFPDRRDVMVLSPLPVAPITILMAKVAASVSVLGLTVLALNVAPGIVCALALGTEHGMHGGVLRSFAGYWFTMVAASVFLYCSVLTVQGLTALLLPRRVFLRLSAILQLVAFFLFIGAYFFLPEITTAAAMAAPANHQLLAWSPCFWFYALCDSLSGSSPAAPMWLVWRAWIGTGIAVFGASVSLLLCYVRTLRKTVEEPDLIPSARGPRWARLFGNSLAATVVLFCIRSLARSRQHRVILAFYLALVFAIAFATLRAVLSASAPHAVTADFILATLMMMSFAVVGFRNVFSLPLSLNANWVLRTTQMHSTRDYVAATRWALILFAVIPVCGISAVLSLSFRPLRQTVLHLMILGLVGLILADLSLIGFYKIPFTCSYLPGKSNIQFIFWGFLVLFVPLAMEVAGYEQRALSDPLRLILIAGVLIVTEVGLWAFNRYRAASAVLYFEELPPDEVTTLRLSTY